MFRKGGPLDRSAACVGHTVHSWCSTALVRSAAEACQLSRVNSQGPNNAQMSGQAPSWWKTHRNTLENGHSIQRR